MDSRDHDELNYSILISRFESSGQWDRVLKTALEWLAREPNLATAHLAAGQSLLNLKRFSEAEPHLAHVLALQPENDIALRFMSIAQFGQKRFEKADECIRRAIALNPNDAYHWLHLANMCYHQEDIGSAGKYAQKARELAPRNPAVLSIVALCGSQGDIQQLQRYKEIGRAHV